MKKINLQEKLSLFQDFWSPKIIGEVNGQYLKLAKVKGELIWHRHEEEDELFMVIKGRLTLQFRNGHVILEPGEIYVVPKGVEHLPVAEEETHLLLLEPKGTAHTGKIIDERTVAEEDQIRI